MRLRLSLRLCFSCMGAGSQPGGPDRLDRPGPACDVPFVRMGHHKTCAWAFHLLAFETGTVSQPRCVTLASSLT